MVLRRRVGVAAGSREHRAALGTCVRATWVAQGPFSVSRMSEWLAWDYFRCVYASLGGRQAWDANSGA